MKKIIVGIFSFVLLFTAQNVFAVSNWNGLSNDCGTVAIANYTTNTGYGSCWTNTSISGSTGDTINVRLYYHNTSNVTATNVRLQITKSSNTSTTHNFMGRIMSDNNGSVSSNVTLNLSSSQSLSFVDARWFPNQTGGSPTAIPNGQVSDILSSGILIGDVLPGGQSQGTIVAVFKVSNNTLPSMCLTDGATNYGKYEACIIPPVVLDCKISSFTINNSSTSTTVTVGDPVTLAWSTSNCDSVYLKYNGSTNKSGSVTFKATNNDFYALGASSYSTPTITKTLSLIVKQPVLVCQDSSANNIGSPLPCTYPAQLCKDISASNYNGAIPCQYPPQLCKDTSANNYGKAIPCTYPAQLCKDISASNYNGAIPCTYPPQLCKDTSALNYNGAIPCTYVQVITVCRDYSATNYLGVLPCQYPVRICQDPTASNYRGALPCEYPVRICNDPGADNYRGRLPCEYPRVISICRDTSASNYGDRLPCYYPPVVAICRDSSASNYLSSGSCYYPPVVSVCRDTTATNYLGTPPCNYIQYVNKNVVTITATNITRNEAQLNGYITDSSYYNSTVYFNYGTTINLGSTTFSKTTNGNTSFNSFLTGLTPNTIYFFQAVAQGTNGITKGSIEVFKTIGNAIVQKTIIIQGTTIIGASSPVELKIINKYELIGAGDLIDYVVTYKNIGKTKLIRPMVQVILPANVSLINASRGTYSVDTHTLSSVILDLAPNEEGTIFIQGRVDSIPLNNSQIATTAILVYTNTNGSQENAMAYVINVPKVVIGGTVEGNSITNNQGATAFFAGFLSIGFIGWLLIIIFILILVLIARTFTRNTHNQTTVHTGPLTH